VGSVDADDLYLLAPEDFTAARDAAAARAKVDGDRPAAAALKALRRPTVAAWLVNLLARSDAPLLDSLLALGPELAQVQATGSGDLLRKLGAQRRSLVDAVTARAAELAQRDVPTAVRLEVSSTLEAALADAGSAEAVRSGRLVRALAYAGFGGVDLEGAVAGLPSRTSARAGASGSGRTARGSMGVAGRKAEQAVAAAEASALAASGELDDAVRRCERLSAEADGTAREVVEARKQAAEAEAAAEAAQAAAREAEHAATAARREADEAEERSRRAARLGEQAVERVRAAQKAAERSRAALHELRRPAPG